VSAKYDAQLTHCIPCSLPQALLRCLQQVQHGVVLILDAGAVLDITLGAVRAAVDVVLAAHSVGLGTTGPGAAGQLTAGGRVAALLLLVRAHVLRHRLLLGGQRDDGGGGGGGAVQSRLTGGRDWVDVDTLADLQLTAEVVGAAMDSVGAAGTLRKGTAAKVLVGVAGTAAGVTLVTLLAIGTGDVALLRDVALLGERDGGAAGAAGGADAVQGDADVAQSDPHAFDTDAGQGERRASPRARHTPGIDQVTAPVLRTAVEAVGAADALQKGTAAPRLLHVSGGAAGAIAAVFAVRADLPLSQHGRQGQQQRQTQSHHPCCL